MVRRIKQFAIYLASFSACFIIATHTSYAKTISHVQDVVIETPASLPQELRQPANAFYLDTNSGDGGAYLYIEQQNGKRLVVLDVTDPAHMKAIRTIELPFAEPFRFGEELNDSYVVLRSMGQKAMAILDMHKAKAPVLQAADAFQHVNTAQTIGQSTFLLEFADAIPTSSPAPREYSVVNRSNNSEFSTLYTVQGVIGTIRREDTGTIFLLGSEGLTVIRDPEQEEEYEAQQRYTN